MSNEWVSVRREDLQALRDELSRWGWGDFHYGSFPQEKSVVDAVALADGYLNPEGTGAQT